MISNLSSTARILAVSMLTSGIGPWAVAIGFPRQVPASITPKGVSIGRDARGVAHIFATTDQGAYYGAGYAAAEDRLFQMCWMRLVVQGRVSEFFGPGSVVNPANGSIKKTHVISDRKARTLGWTKYAAKAIASMDPQTRALLRAYAEGVNARIHDPNMVPDPQFAQHGIPLDDWTAEDCIGAWLRLGEFFGASGLDEARLMHGWQALLNDPLLTHQQRLEQLLGTLVCDDSAALIQELDVPMQTRDAMANYARTHGLSLDDRCEPYSASPHFSQAWAVAGSRTSTGHAVLVGDPRIPVTLPSQLYEWSMQGATFGARGAGVPGSPNILSGSSNQVSWSPTAIGFDQADLVLLQTNLASQPAGYMLDGHRTAFTSTSVETIHVQGESDVFVTYRETYWGPVVTGLVQDVHAGEEYALRRVPFHDPTADPARGFFDMYRATSVGTFFDSLAGWTFPSVNLVFADLAGDIGYSIAGTVPVRNPSLELAGIIAQDGTKTNSDWIDVLPNSLKPHVFDPAAGFVLSANHRPVGNWYPIPIRFGSGGSGDTLRSRRLRELLTQAPSLLTPQQIFDLHHDVVSVAGRDLTEIGSWLKLHSAIMLSIDARRALAELAPWSAAGATMDNTLRGTLVAANIDLSFRTLDAGPELTSRYGGGENGLNLFLKQALAKIRFTPPIDLTPAEVLYVDKVLADAFRAALSVGSTNVWQNWYLQNELTVQLPRWTSLEGFPSLTPGQSVQVGPFRAVDPNTLLSPLNQSYTQFIELGAPFSRWSVAPPGAAEPVSVHDVDQAGLWASEQFKQSPLSLSELQHFGVVSWKFL